METNKPTPILMEKVDDQSSNQTASNIYDHPKLWPKLLKGIILANICLMVLNGNFHGVRLHDTP